MTDNKLVDGDEQCLSELIEETYSKMSERDKAYDARMDRLYDEYYTKCKRDTKHFAYKMYGIVALLSLTIIALRVLA
jgi:hypothetical protein